ncbi:hypothetical protein SAMN05720606_105130 [Paenibacillus polysaccharolyticus]|uniref:Uncharacterized protein n=1 Tax=Paenibacillus polysaccharolyticus TaxID=582692 RepID=A0A1G5G6X2_9BACL|nr:hypothetical protein [Paenibacillus polysaccharolyticus]SCY47029.1 hypothetical protein SAMN05720606_105130 [Paenibacillus polysaccharolyticus]
MKTEMEFEDLMEEAYQLPNGSAKLGFLEEAARVADLNGMVEEAYEARSEIVDVATFCGYPMKALIAFSWQLGKFDQQPELYDEETLLWSYKWILGKMPDFPEISREKIMELLEDFGARFKSYGYSERSYWYYRFRIFMDFGELEEAGRSYDKFRALDRDFMSDCEACEQDEILRYFMLKGDDEKVLEVAKPILKGRMSCAEIPHLTLSEVLMPLYRLGRKDEADKHQVKGYRLIKGENDFVQSFSEQMEYLALTNPSKGIDILEETLVLAADHEDAYAKMMYYAKAALLLRRWAEEKDSEGYRLRLPASFSYEGDPGNLLKLADYFEEYAQATAAKFDQRNGNTHVSSLIA